MQKSLVNDRRHEEGKADLAKLITAAQIQNSQQPGRDNTLTNDLLPDGVTPGEYPEQKMLSKSRYIFQAEFYDHDAKCEAFLILSEQYKALGMEDEANVYNARAKMENATSQGFQAAIDACGKRLEELGYQQKSNDPDFSDSLKSAKGHIEEHKNAYVIASVYTQQVADSEKAIQELEANKSIRPLTPEETNNLDALIQHQKECKRLAEREAHLSADKYKSFQLNLSSANKALEILRLDKHEIPSIAKSPNPPSIALNEQERVKTPTFDGARQPGSNSFSQIAREFDREM